MIFSIPQTKYTDFYDIARFKLIWRINIILTLVLPILTVVLFWLEESAAIPTLFGIGLCIGILVMLKLTLTYFIPTIVFSVFGTFMCQWTLISYPESYHFVDPMWMIIVILFTYFTLGKLWGLICLTINVFGIIYYILVVLVNNLAQLKVLNTDDLIALSINFVICSIIISYLIRQFIKTSKFAENQYRILTNELQESNLEKTIMLKEIHHRVKNNLQVITSLLRLQSREIKDVASKTIYQESINRVIAMALIHEKMYQTENLAKINLEDYIKSLASDLLTSYSLSETVNISVKSDIETINTKHLVPLALIFNELITNSIKHAFENREDGELHISIVNNESHISLVYSDNGEWKASKNETSFGMELIDALTEQLSGSYKRDFKDGTRYHFTFAPVK